MTYRGMPPRKVIVALLRATRARDRVIWSMKCCCLCSTEISRKVSRVSLSELIVSMVPAFASRPARLRLRPMNNWMTSTTTAK